MADNEYLKLLGNKIFWGILATAISVSVYGTMLYANIMESQQQIINSLNSKSQEFEYEIKAIHKDHTDLENRVVKLEVVK